MARVLVVAMDTDYVNFGDQGMPAGFDKQKIEAQVGPELEQLRQQGWEADHCKIRTDGTAGEVVKQQLMTRSYECVLIGAGVRLPVHHLELFETVVNAVHSTAPDAKLAFNTSPLDSAEAVARQMPS